MRETDQLQVSRFAIGSAIIVAVLAMVLPAPALAADPPATPARPAAELESARAEIALTRSNIVLTLEQLDQVRHVEDAYAQFQWFVEQLARMNERAKLTRERAQLMKSKGDAYFAGWEARTGGTSDPEARRQTEAAHGKRKASYDLIIEQMQQARTSFTPLLAELEQIKTLLESERSKEKVAAAKDLFMKANSHCVDLQRTLMAPEHELDSLAVGFSGKDQESAAEQK